MVNKAGVMETCRLYRLKIHLLLVQVCNCHAGCSRADGLLIWITISAPEVIGHDHYGMSADWWGLGCLIYEMTSGQPPFRARGENHGTSEMERRIQTQQEEYSVKFSREAKEFCSLVGTQKSSELLNWQLPQLQTQSSANTTFFKLYN